MNLCGCYTLFKSLSVRVYQWRRQAPAGPTLKLRSLWSPNYATVEFWCPGMWYAFHSRARGRHIGQFQLTMLRILVVTILHSLAVMALYRTYRKTLRYRVYLLHQKQMSNNNTSFCTETAFSQNTFTSKVQTRLGNCDNEYLQYAVTKLLYCSFINPSRVKGEPYRHGIPWIGHKRGWDVLLL